MAHEGEIQNVKCKNQNVLKACRASIILHFDIYILIFLYFAVSREHTAGEQAAIFFRDVQLSRFNAL